MARKYFYFNLNYYGVGFYEEEISVEAEQMEAISVDGGCYGEGATGVLPEQGFEPHLSPKSEEEELEEAENMDCEQSSLFSSRKSYKFTPGQLWELQMVFQETHYPDALRRKELAELMNMDEQKVKVWFNNSRAKLRKTQKTLKNQHLSVTQDHLSIKNMVEAQNVIIFQEQVGDGLFCLWAFCHHLSYDFYGQCPSLLTLYLVPVKNALGEGKYEQD
ncbi:retinal homeobox protein Rx-A-like [Peromyscus eremicus]|uniref:retinal homeobox protein Rx-A-like n=1 Tax=Peromyscus eremicus TaxID=42410 RepID=UPI0027DE498D|nr:retinal homeobox protein Rx-A-like [Peromyscus eremicus]